MNVREAMLNMICVKTNRKFRIPVFKRKYNWSKKLKYYGIISHTKKCNKKIEIKYGRYSKKILVDNKIITEYVSDRSSSK